MDALVEAIEIEPAMAPPISAGAGRQGRTTVFYIDGAAHETFHGTMLIKPDFVSKSAGYGRLEAAAALRALASDEDGERLRLAIVAPDRDAVLESVSPEPDYLARSPRLTLGFTSSRDDPIGWSSGPRFGVGWVTEASVSLDDRSKARWREVLIFVLSAIFGASVSAILEAALARPSA
ncbi:MAG: hypothetical protein AAF192_20230 [Pseudomonadota bacterium]